MIAGKEDIIGLLPYKTPFLFVDYLKEVDDEYCEGNYKIREDEYFFEGHFPGNPIVPGVIITEIMAQIGLVCFGIHLSRETLTNDTIPVFTNSNIDYLAIAKPGDVLTVKSRKVYFRFGKLKCKVQCLKGETIIAQGECSGLIINNHQKIET